MEQTEPRALETVNPLKRLKEGFLDNIVSVGQIARPSGQSALGPAL